MGDDWEFGKQPSYLFKDLSRKQLLKAAARGRATVARNRAAKKAKAAAEAESDLVAVAAAIGVEVES